MVVTAGSDRRPRSLRRLPSSPAPTSVRSNRSTARGWSPTGPLERPGGRGRHAGRPRRPWRGRPSLLSEERGRRARRRGRACPSRPPARARFPPTATDRGSGAARLAGRPTQEAPQRPAARWGAPTARSPRRHGSTSSRPPARPSPSSSTPAASSSWSTTSTCLAARSSGTERPSCRAAHTSLARAPFVSRPGRPPRRGGKALEGLRWRGGRGGRRGLRARPGRRARGRSCPGRSRGS